MRKKIHFEPLSVKFFLPGTLLCILLYIQKVHFDLFHNLHKVVVKKENNNKVSMVSMIKESPQDRASTSSQEALANKKRAVRKERKRNLGKINF